MHGNIEKVPIIVINAMNLIYKIKINIFLPEMLCIVVLAAESNEL